jgi:S-adenosylmethionine:tRNA ribosyltransferase-isomerase
VPQRSDFEYHLPEELIAQFPSERREDSRLMVIDRGTGEISHHRFHELPDRLLPDDLLVLNDTRVLPARLRATKPNGTAIEILLLQPVDAACWEALIRPARRCPPGTRLILDEGKFEAAVEGVGALGKRLLRFSPEGSGFWAELERLGQVPLPPYIRRAATEEDRRRYQTVFAEQAGSVAAPTAGLHFTDAILRRIRHCRITLHVGYGTFRPLEAERIEDHRMDAEAFILPADAASAIGSQQEAGNRVIAVGTTTTRTLEHVIRTHGKIVEASGTTDLFIYPGFQFRAIDGLITNFHLPGSTLLLLVSAFAGTDLTRHAYETAVRERYRFYSYGDAMLIL